MVQVLDPILIVALALNFVALGVSRIRGVVLVAVTIALKAIVIPWFLVHAMRGADIQHEVMPVVNYMSSLLLGSIGTALALAFSYTLPLADEHTNLLLVPVAMATVWTGFLML